MKTFIKKFHILFPPDYVTQRAESSTDMFKNNEHNWKKNFSLMLQIQHNQTGETRKRLNEVVELYSVFIYFG